MENELMETDYKRSKWNGAKHVKPISHFEEMVIILCTYCTKGLKQATTFVRPCCV